MKAVLYHLITTILSIIFLLAGTVFFVFATETGTSMALRIVSALLYEQFSVGAIQGRLLDSLRLDNFVYKSAHIDLQAKHIQLQWRASSLLYGNLLINSMSVDNAHVQIKKDTSKDESLTTHQKKTSELPLPIEIKQLHLQHIIVQYADEHAINIDDLTGRILLNKDIFLDIQTHLLSPWKMKGRLFVQGTPTDYQWRLLLQNYQSDWLASGQGGENGLTLTTAKNKFLGGQLSAIGQLSWLPTRHWQFSIQAKSLDLKLLHANAPRNLSFNAKTTGDIHAFNIDITDIQAIQQNMPLHGYFKLQTYVKSSALKDQQFSFIQGLNVAIDTSMQLGNAYSRVQGSLSDQWHLDYKINIPMLNKLLPTVTGGIDFAGTLRGVYAHPELNAKLLVKQLKYTQQADAMFQGELTMHALALLERNQADIKTEISLKESQLHYKLIDKTLIFPFNGSFKTQSNHNVLTSQLDLQLHHQKFIHADLVLPDYQLTHKLLPNQIIHGKIQSQLDQSQISGLNIAMLENPQGSLVTNLQLNGTLEKPNVHGEATLQSQQLVLPKQGLRLQNLHLSANAENAVIHYTGSVTSGKGTLQLQGKTLLKNAVLASSFLISGKQFLASNTAKIKLEVSPDLRIENKIDGWHVDGKIAIPKADIKLIDITKTITLPPETIIMKPSGAIEQDKTLPIFAQIALILGDNVRLETSGLSSLVSGRLLIKDYSGSETLATGRLALTQGTYDLQGQKLVVNNSAFIFTNSLINNPNLNIRAIKIIHYAPTQHTLTQQRNLTVGILVTGTAENPNILLFSDPAGWSQPDILSLILLEQPASMASGANLQLLTMAAKALTPQTGTSFSQFNQQLQQFLGLSEFGIQANISNQTGVEENSTSFVLGKYLSPRLYLNYSLSVLNSVNTLRLRYLLSKNWFIQTQANTLGSGVDIVYSIEH